jgi:type I restriction enzyme M protein
MGPPAGYEGLLQKNAAEKKSGAGQYFTPRVLIVCRLRLLQPKPGKVVQDPAAGTGGLLVAADRYIKERSDGLFALPKAQQEFQRRNAFTGLELVPSAHRLLMMNLLLHGIEPDSVKGGDALGPDGEGLGQADLILSNPPFGKKRAAGGRCAAISPVRRQMI